VHYDTKDGLAGSTVYRICQDKQGYLWFATDNGVSRFDGKRFKNFTTEDGLTDNDVIYIASDSKGRIWMAPFNKSICYYYEGKIYSSENDSALKNTSFSSWVVMSGENEKGEVYLATTEGIFLYTNSGELKKIVDYKELGKKYSMDPRHFIPVNLRSQPRLHKNSPLDFILLTGNNILAYRDDTFAIVKKGKVSTAQRINFYLIDDSLDMVFPDDKLTLDHLTIVYLGNNEWMYNTMKGSWIVYLNGQFNPDGYLLGKKVSNAIRDTEGNIWFATIGDGIYRLTSPSMKTISMGQEAFALEKMGNKMYAGFANGKMVAIEKGVMIKEYSFEKEFDKLIARRLYTMKHDGYGNLFLGFDLHFGRINGDKILIRTLKRSVKSIDIIDKNTIVAGNNTFTALYRTSDLTVIDTIWHERATKVIYDKGTYYIGTLEGLVKIDPTNKKTTHIGTNYPQLRKRIVDLYKMPDNSIWIATNDNGVVLYKNDKVDTIIDENNGLSSNICKSLFVKDQYLWVGTSKGINKIDLSSRKVVAQYNVSNGLASDVINSVYVDDSLVWVSSPAGVTYFKEKDISDTSICNLDLTSIVVSGNKLTDSSYRIQLSHRDNNISFDYTAISFKSAGEITYSYKLSGLDNAWNETKLTTLSYPSLPPGDYELLLYATNKFGKRSETISIPFSINAPFWKTIWFWIMVSLITTGIAWYLISRRYKRLQERMKEKNETRKRMTELEQASLRAQMNPHFIFNCLNSIQHFILKDDVKQTNHYITQFGSLIRKTMDNSARAVITIADEITYLSSYLDLEHMRFSSKFRYEIYVDPSIHTDYTYIPSMLIQPFVENAIRHGIRNKQDDEGFVSIRFEQDKEHLLISIEDNGVGREASKRSRSEQHIEYQSKGITLTQKRIDILNINNEEKVSTTFIDLKDENGCPKGTRVVLTFPITLLDKNSLS
jgi:ligand-binding sensor domain-containing protein